jgi:RNA polymerase sigma factor (sigma-70 family)
MRRYADGDRSAFADLFAAIWPIVLSSARRQLPNPADADDAAQQALLSVFSRIVEFDSSRDGLTWILGITAYEVRTLRKKSQRRREDLAVDLDQLETIAPTQEDLTILAELRQALTDVVAALSLQDQEVLAVYASPGLVTSPLDATGRKRRERTLRRLRTAWTRLRG